MKTRQTLKTIKIGYRINDDDGPNGILNVETNASSRIKWIIYVIWIFKEITCRKIMMYILMKP